MKIFILFILLFSVSPILRADHYVVERDDGGIVEIEYLEGSTDSLDDVLKSLRLDGNRIKKVLPSELPSTADRDYWIFNVTGKKIIVDQDKKNQDMTNQQAKEERKRALLKMTAQEYAEAKQLGIIR